MQQAQTAQRPKPDTQAVAGLLEGVTRALALSVEVFLHRGFGAGYVGCGPLALLLMFLFEQFFFSGQDAQPLVVFAGIFGVFWLIAAINALIRWFRKIHTVRSRYNGRPHLCSLLRGWKETNVKHLESLLVIGFGFVVHLLSRPLGDYLMASGIFIFLRGWSMASMIRQRAVELNDAVLEQREIAEQFREMQQDEILQVKGASHG
jgi:hypothetical protein